MSFWSGDDMAGVVMKRVRLAARLAAWAACFLWAQNVPAQFDLEFADPVRIGSPAESATATVSARLMPVANSDEVLLSITVETSPDGWTYAIGGAYSGKTVVTIADA